MANFHTHLGVALAASTALAAYGCMLGVFGAFEMVVLSFLGAIGGLLPDIDLEHAKISRMVFYAVSLFGASFLVFLLSAYPTPWNRSWGILHKVALWAILFLVLRFGVFGVFCKITKHRGIVHSVPYMALLSLALVLAAYHGMQLSAKLSWLFGIFLFFGTIIHLLLDEIYSVDVRNLRIKKSFGTALKFFERKRALAYGFLYVWIALLLFFAPPTADIVAWAQKISTP